MAFQAAAAEVELESVRGFSIIALYLSLNLLYRLFWTGLDRLIEFFGRSGSFSLRSVQVHKNKRLQLLSLGFDHGVYTTRAPCLHFPPYVLD